MIKLLFAAVSAALLLAGCASLTKSQVEAVNHFAHTSAGFSAYPSKIMSALADVRIKRGLYYANTLDDADAHIDEINNMYASSKEDYAVAEKADVTFKILDKYAQSLLLLTADKHTANLDSQAVSFGTGLDSLISTYNKIPNAKPVHSGLGGLVGSLVLAGGEVMIRSKQCKAIEQYVPEADTLIAVMTDNLLEFLQSTNIDLLIRAEERQIQSDYKTFIRHRTPTVDNERDYFQLKKDLDAIKTLREQTVAATKALRKAHSGLTAEVEKKKDVKEIVEQLQTFYDSVKGVKTTIAALTAKN